MKRSKYIIIIALTVIVILAITILVVILNETGHEDSEEEIPSNVGNPVPAAQSTQRNTETTNINKFRDLASNLPDKRIQLIEEVLFDTIALNIPKKQVADVTDAVVRDNSYKQTPEYEDQAKQISFTTFIVDIPSLKQSYRVNDYYSPLPAAQSGLYDYSTLVLCLKDSELIYGEFACVDRIKHETGQ